MTLSLALRILGYWLAASVVCVAVWALSRRLVDHEPPHRERRRRQLRALREVETLTPTAVWPEPEDQRRGWR